MRNPSLSVIERNGSILARIRRIKEEHPFWGYRRVWAWLRYKEHVLVNKKRVFRLMQENGLTIKPNERLKAKRLPEKPKPRPLKPRQWWGIDMTKVLTPYGWVYIVLVLDWYTKRNVGYHAGSRALSKDWLEALDRAIKVQFPKGSRGMGLNLMSDNGSQPTSEAFVKACGLLGLNQAFTSYSNPKGNADTERVMRTLKEELVHIREWKSQGELTCALECWIRFYNEEYLHSSLGYKSRTAFEKEWEGEEMCQPAMG
jgi:transposase InsO family protein